MPLSRRQLEALGLWDKTLKPCLGLEVFAGLGRGPSRALLFAVRLSEEVGEEDEEEHALYQQHPGRQPRPVAVLDEKEPHALRHTSHAIRAVGLLLDVCPKAPKP